jgi:DNA-binding GntR family transcriptional regulator
MGGALLRSQTLVAATADAIRTAIRKGEIQPGQPLREVELAESLEVSRSTVREALRLLREETLVELTPFRGARVTSLTLRMAREIRTMREMLEPCAIRLAMKAQAYSAGKLKQLEFLAERLRELEPQQGAVYETIRADLEFHWLVCEPCDHTMLLEAYSRVQSLTWLFLINSRIYQSDTYLSGPTHREILEAIQAGDVGVAEETLRKHINMSGQALLDYMVRKGELTLPPYGRRGNRPAEDRSSAIPAL